ECVPEIDQAARDDDQAEIEGKKAGARPFDAPADSHLQAADDDNDTEKRDTDGDADLDVIMQGAAGFTLCVGHIFPLQTQSHQPADKHPPAVELMLIIDRPGSRLLS